MEKYETYIFDLDDTLISKPDSIKYAFAQALNYLGIPFNEELLRLWLQYDVDYWHLCETGTLQMPSYVKTVEERKRFLRTNCFYTFFKNLNLDWETCTTIDQIYLSMLSENVVEIPGAHDVLKELSSNHEIVIATNGSGPVAKKKLEKARLLSYISSIVSSEEVGYTKPNKEFFDVVLSECKNPDKENKLMIGDSLTTDILGGMKNGIPTC